MLAFNKPALTARCLASVLQAAQSHALANHKILLIDNGSEKALSAPDPVEILRLEPNLGFAKGMNAGLRKAFDEWQGAQTLLLSNDVELPADFYRHLPEARAEATITCPHVYNLIDRARAAFTHGTLNLEAFELAHHFDPTISKIRFPAYYPAAATLWNLKAYQSTKGFNEEYFCYWEDVELSYRCAKLGVELVSAPMLRVHHLGRGTTGGKAAYSRYFELGRELTRRLIS